MRRLKYAHVGETILCSIKELFQGRQQQLYFGLQDIVKYVQCISFASHH